MHSPSVLHQSAILTSWKEVAAYLGKGVRTVQRWEKFDHLPVRRVNGSSKIIVYRSELDHWLRSQTVLDQASPSGLAQQIQIARELRRQHTELQVSVQSAMEQLANECRRMSTLISIDAVQHKH